jgi:hypothetical protein
MKPWNANPSGCDSLANFAGEIPDKNLLVLLTRNRDSDLLSESNWHTVLKFLGGESGSVQIVRHGHWACGWVEYMMIDSNDKDMLALAESVEAKLNDYPIWDENDFSNREYEAAASYWEFESIAERVRIIQRYGKPYVSVFAARRAELPQNDNGSIFEHCAS